VELTAAAAPETRPVANGTSTKPVPEIKAPETVILTVVRHSEPPGGSEFHHSACFCSFRLWRRLPLAEFDA
jgi:hypothetical protein